MAVASPIPTTERLTIVDIVRGFALTGVLIANFTAYSEQNLPSDVFNSICSPLDKTLTGINTVFVEWKFFTLFSILFGYGFGLILASLEKKNINATPFFLRRMACLFVFGVIHSLFWWGDVLHLYAIAGVFLLLFRKSTIRTILIFSFLFMFIFPPLISFLLGKPESFFSDVNMRWLSQVYEHGNLFEVFRANSIFYYKAFIISGIDLSDLTETLGRFLFGYALLKLGLFERVETKKAIFIKVLLITTPIVISYFIIRWLSLKGDLITKGILWGFFLKVGILSTTCLYVSLLVLSYISIGKKKFFSALQALGKMTLTNYFGISAFLIVLLYGLGFGKISVLTMHIIWIYALVFLLIEIVFSFYWLRKFRYGPAEWIWRQLTYKKRLPLRR